MCMHGMHNPHKIKEALLPLDVALHIQTTLWPMYTLNRPLHTLQPETAYCTSISNVGTLQAPHTLLQSMVRGDEH